ncbi:uncharacterized protein VTP21DRAFT_3843 [Calcarisporiella thermophila]|uniref:uncharacterized protein n=1 Tax=Calcarisporiella thermophila TaxID=911321 RepID=UPI003743AE3C
MGTSLPPVPIQHRPISTLWLSVPRQRDSAKSFDSSARALLCSLPESYTAHLDITKVRGHRVLNRARPEPVQRERVASCWRP